MSRIPSHIATTVEGDHRPAKFEIHFCPERKVPICGNLVGAPKYLYLKPECETGWKEAASGGHPGTADFDLNTREGRAGRAVADAKFYVPLLGARFNWRWFAWNAKHLVYRPLLEEIWPYLRSSRTSFSPGRVEAALSAREELWQAERDGLQNLMPLIILFQKSPKELKALLGKAAWKKLASNAKTRNRAICLLAGKRCEKNEDVLADMVRFLTTIETSVIRYFLGWDFEISQGLYPLSRELITAARQSGTYAQEDIENHLRLYRDTAAPLDFENRRCNPVWSNKRLRREHDRAIRRMMRNSARPSSIALQQAPALHSACKMNGHAGCGSGSHKQISGDPKPEGTRS